MDYSPVTPTSHAKSCRFWYLTPTARTTPSCNTVSLSPALIIILFECKKHWPLIWCCSILHLHLATRPEVPKVTCLPHTDFLIIHEKRSFFPLFISLQGRGSSTLHKLKTLKPPMSFTEIRVPNEGKLRFLLRSNRPWPHHLSPREMTTFWVVLCPSYF